MEWMDGGGRVISLCVVVVVVVSQVDMGGIPGVDCWLCMANIVGSFVILSQCMESLRGDSSNFSVCSLFALSFWPRDGSVSYIFFILVVGVASNQISSLSLSDFHLFVLVVFVFFLSLFFCYLLHSVCSYNVWLPLLF